MSSTIARQARDIALVRAIGATPGRVRRAIALQAALVAVPATLVGVPIGTLGGQWWIHGLVSHHVVPAGVVFHPSGAALPVALAVTVSTSLLGALIAAVRPSRVRPAVALTETAAPPGRASTVRMVLGLVLTIGGIGLSIGISHLPADQADDAGFFVILAMCLGAGLLGPSLLRVAAPVARVFGGTGQIAADNVAARAKAMSGALVPLVLAVAFATVKVALHTTSAHVAGVPDAPAALWTDYSGTAVYTAFAAVAALNTLITVVLARRRELAVTQLAGATRARVIGVVICEAFLVTGTGLVAAAGVAAATLLPLVHTSLGTWLPYLPLRYLAVGVAGVAALVGLGIALPAALAVRRPAIEAAEGAT